MLNRAAPGLDASKGAAGGNMSDRKVELRLHVYNRRSPPSQEDP